MNRLTVKEASELMECSEQFVRLGLQKRVLPFGFAIKNKSKWCYYISPRKFEEATGIECSTHIKSKY